MGALYQLFLFMVVMTSQLYAVNDTIECEDEEENDCSKCYAILVSKIVQHDGNMFNLTSVFFPPDDESPVFVIVYYHFFEDGSNSNKSQVWYWSTSTFYLFQPLHVLLFTSLFFSDTRLQSSSLHLTLPTSCLNQNESSHMMLLTQRVSYK